MPKIKILIAENSYIIKKGLIAIIEELDDFDIQVEFSDFNGFVKNIASFKPAIVISGSGLLKQNSSPRLEKLKDEYNYLWIGVIYSENDLKSELYNAYTELNNQSPNFKNLLYRNLKEIEIKKKILQTDHELSEREKDIVALVAKGFTNKEIAETLFISIHTAMTHRKNIVKKLGIKTVSGLTVYAILNKLIEMKDLK